MILWKPRTVDRTEGWRFQYPENYQKYETVNKNKARCVVGYVASS
jgi:hypothetical protein